MHVFPVTVSGKVAAYTGNDRYVCGNSDFVVELTLDEEWAQHDTKTARFVYGAQHTDIVFTGNTVSVPVIEKAYEIRFGIFAGNLYTTTPAVIPCDLSIRSYDGAPKDPEPDVYDQIMDTLNNHESRIKRIEVTGGGGGEGTGGGAYFTPGNALELTDDFVLNVKTTNEAEEDNTLPITSAGVYTVVGNIGALLDTI